MKKPLFIAFEGIDGSGKSTQVKLLKEILEAKGFKVHTTFEPTDGFIGKNIREIFNHKKEADHRTIAGLFIADRLDHILHTENGMLLKQNQGYIVITDRYYLSSYAYHGTHTSMDWVIAGNSLSAELMRPDINIYIEMPVEKAMERLLKHRTSIELYETAENLQNVSNKYEEAFEKVKDSEVIFKINGDQDPDKISIIILDKILSLLP